MRQEEPILRDDVEQARRTSVRARWQAHGPLAVMMTRPVAGKGELGASIGHELYLISRRPGPHDIGQTSDERNERQSPV